MKIKAFAERLRSPKEILVRCSLDIERQEGDYSFRRTQSNDSAPNVLRIAQRFRLFVESWGRMGPLSRSATLFFNQLKHLPLFVKKNTPAGNHDLLELGSWHEDEEYTECHC